MAQRSNHEASLSSVNERRLQFPWSFLMKRRLQSSLSGHEGSHKSGRAESHDELDYMMPPEYVFFFNFLLIFSSIGMSFTYSHLGLVGRSTSLARHLVDLMILHCCN